MYVGWEVSFVNNEGVDVILQILKSRSNLIISIDDERRDKIIFYIGHVILLFYVSTHISNLSLFIFAVISIYRNTWLSYW